MTSVQFEGSNADDFDNALKRIRWEGALDLGPRRIGDGKHIPDHIKPLYSPNLRRGCPKIALENADFLAMGYQRLLVVLLEPAREEWYSSLKENPNQTLLHVNELLREASANKLGVENTCIFDVRTLRYWRDREEDTSDTLKRDERAYEAFETMVQRLKPDVVIALQCAAHDAQNETARILSSRLEHAGSVTNITIKDRRVTVIYGFHPGLYLSTYRDKDMGEFMDEKPVADFRQVACNLLRLIFHMAINKLAGRDVEGAGIAELRQRFLWSRAQIQTIRTAQTRTVEPIIQVSTSPSDGDPMELD